jgi:hypothetical protein
MLHKRLKFFFIFSLLIVICACGGKIDSKPIKINFKSSSDSQEIGTVIYLSWSSENSEKCIASGDWSGEKDLSGTEEITLLKESNHYILTCHGSSGYSVSKAIQIEGYRFIKGSVRKLNKNSIFRIFYDNNNNNKYDDGEDYTESNIDGTFKIKYKHGVISAELLDESNGENSLFDNIIFTANLDSYQEYIHLSFLTSLEKDEFLSLNLKNLMGFSELLNIGSFNIDASKSINSEYKKVWITENQISSIHFSLKKILNMKIAEYSINDTYEIISSAYSSNDTLNDISSFSFIKNLINLSFEHFGISNLEESISRDIATSLLAIARIYESSINKEFFNIFSDFIFDVYINDINNLIKNDNDNKFIVSNYQSNLVHYSYISQNLDSPINHSYLKKNISIPIKDITEEFYTVLDKEMGQYLGHPSSVMLNDKSTILVVYPKGHGAGEIVYKKSYDSGLTWTPRLNTPSSWKTSREVPIIYKMKDSNNFERLILFSSLYPIRSSISEDNGNTWSELKPIGNFGGIVAIASIIKKQDGSYIGFFHDDGRFIDGKGGEPPDYNSKDTRFKLYSTISSDGGLTWSEPLEIYSDNELYLCEPGAILSPDGKQIALLLRENKRIKNSHIIFSDDGGISWSYPRELPAALTGDRHIAKYINDNQILVSYRDRSIDRIFGGDNDYYGDWVAWVGSFDDLRYGYEGYKKIRIMDNKHPNDAAYTGIEILEDGSILGISYGHWTTNEQPFIVAKKIHIE